MAHRLHRWSGPALALVLVAGATAAAPVPPGAPAEAWVYVQTDKGHWAIRVDGGPPKQVKAERPSIESNGPKTVFLNDVRPFPVHAWEIEGGKRVLYREDIPETFGRGKKSNEERTRLVVADPKGQNPKTLVAGLSRSAEYTLTADGKAVVCGVERDGKWGVYRAAFDGTEPTKLSRTDGTDGIRFRTLRDGRIAYFAITGEHVEPLVFKGKQVGTSSTPVGTVVLIDGKAEKVLIKETMTGLPEFTADGSKMAARGTSDSGEPEVTVTDLKTNMSERFPLSAFNREWKCQFRDLRFRADGNALTVTFYLGGVVYREKGPIPGDEAVQHFGVIWLDGRKQRTALFEIDQPRKENNYYADLRWLAWGPRPALKD